MADKYKCGICCEKVKTQAYGCEICSKWIHAKCAFPNATIDDLKILHKSNSGFVIQCIFCKQEAKSTTIKLALEIQESNSKNSSCMSFQK